MTQKEIHTQEKEPALFEEKKEPPKKGKMKIFVLLLAVLLGAFFWPKPVIKGKPSCRRSGSRGSVFPVPECSRNFFTKRVTG